MFIILYPYAVSISGTILSKNPVQCWLHCNLFNANYCVRLLRREDFYLIIKAKRHTGHLHCSEIYT